MRRILVAALLAAPPPLAAQHVPAVVRLPGQINRVIIDTMGTPFEVPVPAPRLFQALLAVYADLKVPVEVRDSAAGQVGNGSFSRRGTLGGQALSTYLSCGQDMVGQHADTYKVTMFLLSTATPKAADRSILRTILMAGAANVAEGAREPLPCESLGALEMRIDSLVRKKLELPPASGR